MRSRTDVRKKYSKLIRNLNLLKVLFIADVYLHYRSVIYIPKRIISGFDCENLNKLWFYRSNIRRDVHTNKTMYTI